jgi:hypothetical protein
MLFLKHDVVLCLIIERRYTHKAFLKGKTKSLSAPLALQSADLKADVITKITM